MSENEETIITNHLLIEIADSVKEDFEALKFNERVDICFNSLCDYKVNTNNQSTTNNQYIILYFLRILINENLGNLKLNSLALNKLYYIAVHESHLPSCVKLTITFIKIQYQAVLILRTLLDYEDESITSLYDFNILIEFVNKSSIYKDNAILYNIIQIIGKIYLQIISRSKDLRSSEYNQVIIFIYDLFTQMNLINIAILKKVIWLIDIVIDDYSQTYFDVSQVIITLILIIEYSSNFRKINIIYR